MSDTKFKEGNPGRPKGAKNKKTRELHDKAFELGVNPFEVMLLFAKGDHEALGYKVPIPMDLRLNAAKEATNYLYSKKRSITVKNDTVNLPQRTFPFPDPTLQPGDEGE